MSIQYCAKVVIFLRKERKEMEGGNGVRQRRTELRIRRNGEQNAVK
jgi:ribosomal protein L21